MAGDHVYIFVPDRYPRLLDRLFASRAEVDPEDADFFGAFAVDPGPPGRRTRSRLCAGPDRGREASSPIGALVDGAARRPRRICRPRAARPDRTDRPRRRRQGQDHRPRPFLRADRAVGAGAGLPQRRRDRRPRLRRLQLAQAGASATAERRRRKPAPSRGGKANVRRADRFAISGLCCDDFAPCIPPRSR